MLSTTLLLILSLNASSSDGHDRSGIRWMEDNWTKAKAEAKASGKLVAVDVWATWCHACLSMKETVLTDPQMKSVREQHVWLALDYDKPQNAAFFERFSITSFPTFMVLDPKDERVVARWKGTGNAEQMRKFFSRAGSGVESPVAKIIVRGQRALAESHHEKALDIFSKALQQKQKQLEARERTLLLSGKIEALWKIDPRRCATEGSKALHQVDDSIVGVDFVGWVVYCASKLPPKEQKAVMAAVRDRLHPLINKTLPAFSVDDRSGLYGTMIDVLDALGESNQARQLTRQRLAFLEDAASKAASIDERIVFDAHRFDCYMRLRNPTAAVAMLQKSESDRPEDFNHSWRLAKAYLAQKRPLQGLAAIDRALSTGYGSRRIRLYATKFDLLMQYGAYERAGHTLVQARAELDGLQKSSPNQVRSYLRRELESRERRLEVHLPAG